MNYCGRKAWLRVTKKVPQRDKINRHLEYRQRNWKRIGRPDNEEKLVTYQVVDRWVGGGEIENLRPLDQTRQMRRVIRPDVATAKRGTDRQNKREGKCSGPQNARPTPIYG